MTTPLLALGAGMLTVASPCVLPMLPMVLGASVGQRHPARPLCIAAGFALSFAALAIAFASAPRVLGVSHEALRSTAIAMLLLFGTLSIWPRPFQWLAAQAGPLLGRVSALGDAAGTGPLGGVLVGLSLGAVWTPCAGPVLGSVLTLIATEPATGDAAVMLGAYATGAALPMLLIAYGGQYATTRVQQLARYTHRLQQAFGVLIVAFALALLFDVDTQLVLWLTGAWDSASTPNPTGA